MVRILTTMQELASTPLAPGQVAPDFTLPASGGQTVSLHDLKGKRHAVLVFYCRNSTPG